MATPTETELSRRMRAISPHRRGLRWAWITLGSLFAVPLLLFGTLQVVSQLAHDEDTVVMVFPATGIRTLDVRVDAGEIRVIGTDEDTITVNAHISNGLQKTTRHETIEGDALVLQASCPSVFSNFCSVDYTVEVPRGVRVVARTESSRIIASDLTGGARLMSTDGGIEVSGLAGAIDLRSDNGSITADDLRATDLQSRSRNGSVRLTLAIPPQRVGASSDNGGITIVVPDTDDMYATDLSTNNGKVSSRIRTDPASARTLTARSGNGSITVRYPTG